MATVATNNKLTTYRGGVLGYPVDQAGASAFNQGDLVYFDTSALVLKAITSDANCQYLAGVALISSSLALYAAADTQTAVKNIEPFAPVGFGDVFGLLGIAGQTYAHGTSVYYSTDAQHVTAQAGSYLIGKVWNPAATAALSGAVTVPVLVMAAYPAAGF